MPDTGHYRLQDLKLRWQRDPSSRLFLQLADEHRKLGQLAEAIAVLEEGLENRPNDLSGMVSLGRCRLEVEQAAAAIEPLEAVVGRDPTHIIANKLLLEAYLQHGDAEKAGQRLDTYRLLNDRDPELDHLVYRLDRLRADDGEAATAVVADAPEPDDVVAAEGGDLFPGEGIDEAEERWDVDAVPVEEEPWEAVDVEEEPWEAVAVEDEPVEAAAFEEGSEEDEPVEATFFEEEPLEEEHLAAAPLEDEPVEAAAFEEEPLEDEILEAAPLEEEPLEDEILEAAPLEEEPLEDEILEAAPLEEEPAGEEEQAAPVEPFPVQEKAVEEIAVPPAGAAQPLGSDPFQLGGAPPAAPDLGELWEHPPSPRPGLTDPFGELSALDADHHWELLAREGIFTAPSAPSAPPALSAAVGEADAGAPAAAGVAAGVLAAGVAAVSAAAMPGREAAAPPDVEAEPAAPAEPAEPEAPEPVAEAAAEEEAPPEPEAELPAAATPAGEAAAEEESATATLGELYLKQGHREEAERIFRRVLEKDPHNARALAGLDQLAARPRRGRLTAADLLAVKSASGRIPEGLTAKKVLVLGNYIQHLRAADKHVH